MAVGMLLTRTAALRLRVAALPVGALAREHTTSPPTASSPADR
jgi:hypothetical protein